MSLPKIDESWVTLEPKEKKVRIRFIGGDIVNAKGRPAFRTMNGVSVFTISNDEHYVVYVLDNLEAVQIDEADA